jgi:ABC-type spermidine/putrescine transport system permease subunit I
MRHGNRRLDVVLILGVVTLTLLPWYRIDGGFYGFGWLAGFPLSTEAAPGLVQIAVHDRLWLAGSALLLLLAVAARSMADPMRRGAALAFLGALGILFLSLQGLAIGFSGWTWTVSESLFGALSDGQPSMGAGAVLSAVVFVLLFAFGLAERGVMKGDAFVVSAISLLVFLVAVFVFYPIGSMFAGSVQDFDGSFNPDGFIRNMQDPGIWSLSCVIGGGRCGVAWRTLWLAIMTGLGSTLLGLAFALVATRTRFPYKKGLRLLTILPIITPPFVIGLALTLLFGRAGVVTQGLSDLFGIEPGRWLYGLTGIWIAQVLSFTPIAFLVLIGVVEGVSPSMEEASTTLRADRWRTFRRVSLPLMKPGLANAFLIGFIESMADFGNPLVLGGSHGVLSTEIFFAVVGSQNDPSRAAVLATVLLVFTLSAFLAQRFWLSGKNFATVTGKGDSGAHIALPRGVSLGVHAIVIPWGLFTLVVYGMILVGGFVKTWGPRQLADARPLRQGLLHRLRRRHRLDGRCLELVLDDDGDRADLRTADGHRRPSDGLHHRAPEIHRQERLRVRADDELCHSRHGHRRQLHHGLQPAPAGDDRLGTDPHRLLRLPQHAGRRARRDCGDEPARQEPGRGLADAACRQLPHHPQGHPAAPAARHHRRARLFLRARHHLDQRRHLPRQRRIQHGDLLYRRPRRERRVRRGDRLFLHADRRDDHGHHRLPASRGRTAPAP